MSMIVSYWIREEGKHQLGANHFNMVVQNGHYTPTELVEDAETIIINSDIHIKVKDGILEVSIINGDFINLPTGPASNLKLQIDKRGQEYMEEAFAGFERGEEFEKSNPTLSRNTHIRRKL